METETAKPLPPQEVIDYVNRQVRKLEVLTRARQTDLVFYGQGRYEAEAYLNHQCDLDDAWARLAEFEELCEKYKIDPAPVYALTAEPARLSQKAKDWLESSPPASNHVKQ
jgi:hypothetical protein